ncbi:MAG: phospho-N-acetylmuramoyl-pentapeptide-transferase [Parcubacteria group bacterium]|nr:phospho-N-acetylmuramoyl-pentapeptide-transferase [Parcubacteria group bacterium]
MTVPTAELTSIILLATVAFLIAILWAPSLIKFLRAAKMGKGIRSAEEAPIYAQMHAKKAGTPTMGGILIWVTVLLLAFLPSILPGFDDINFLSRKETWLPLGALVASALVGLVDDYLNVKRIGPHGGGIRARHRLFLYTVIASIGAWWFFYKLDWDLLHVPFFGTFALGWWYIPIFIIIIVATSFSVNEADGLDGLAGGLLLAAYGAFGAIAFAQGKYDLAALCAVIVGAIVAFLWYNIHPARFFLGDTGAMSLGVTLGIVAMLTNYALLLPIICLPFVIESVSVIIQILSKKFRNKKVFRVAPIHHHFEAIGWPEPQIVMRAWMIAGVTAVVGLALALADMVTYLPI